MGLQWYQMPASIAVRITKQQDGLYDRRRKQLKAGSAIRGQTRFAS